jgi:hypothetical protein
MQNTARRFKAKRCNRSIVHKRVLADATMWDRPATVMLPAATKLREMLSGWCPGGLGVRDACRGHSHEQVHAGDSCEVLLL